MRTDTTSRLLDAWRDAERAVAAAEVAAEHAQQAALAARLAADAARQVLDDAADAIDTSRATEAKAHETFERHTRALVENDGYMEELGGPAAKAYRAASDTRR